jgi:hypothetical protein
MMYPCGAVGPSPRLGEAETPPEAEVGVEPTGWARRRPPSEAEVEAEPWGRARRSPPSEAEVGSEPWGRARRRPPSEAEVEAEPWVRRGRDLLLRPRPKVGRGEAFCCA